MKTFGLTMACIAALLGGARLIFAAFAPVLPTDFDRRWDPHHVAATGSATWNTYGQVKFFMTRGRWARSVDELVSIRDSDWKERNPSGWERYVTRLEEEMQFVRADDVSVVRYLSRARPEEWDGPVGGASCTVTLDAEYARSFSAWIDTPAGRRAFAKPEALDLWPRMDCRTLAGVRAWLSWTGVDRYREPPSERYSPLTYAERAWAREAGDGPPPYDPRQP